MVCSVQELHREEYAAVHPHCTRHPAAWLKFVPSPPPPQHFCPTFPVLKILLFELFFFVAAVPNQV